MLEVRGVITHSGFDDNDATDAVDQAKGDSSAMEHRLYQRSWLPGGVRYDYLEFRSHNVEDVWGTTAVARNRRWNLEKKSGERAMASTWRQR